MVRSSLLVDLRRHWSAALSERQHLDRRIEALEALIEQELAASRSDKPVSHATIRSVVRTSARPGGPARRRSLAGTVLQALRASDGPLGFSELRDKVIADLGNDVNEGSLRSSCDRIYKTISKFPLPNSLPVRARSADNFSNVGFILQTFRTNTLVIL